MTTGPEVSALRSDGFTGVLSGNALSGVDGGTVSLLLNREWRKNRKKYQYPETTGGI